MTPAMKNSRWGPYRQASPPPARHRLGARSARRGSRRHPTADRLLQGATVMTFLLGTWLRAMKRNAAPDAPARPGARRTRPRRIAPRLEALEDRTVPSTLTVTNNLDTGAPGDGSLRGEIAAAQSGDVINFAPSLLGQTIRLTGGELAITRSLDVEGPGANQLTVTGNHASRVFDISAGVTVTIAGMTVTDGLANGSSP